VLEELTARGWVLGGEGSGHLLVLDRHSTGDGIISALQVLQAVIRSGKPLADQLDGVKLFPQSLVNVQLRQGFDWRTDGAFQATLRAVESELGQSGRVLVRPSGTEPVLRVMVETGEPATARRLAQKLADVAGKTTDQAKPSV
jgi:phosphoglucosamine mutase